MQGQFRKYDHLERYGHVEVRGIADGHVHIFPKLDGTNASAWADSNGEVQCGSRNRVLSAEADNHGFHAWVHSDCPRAVALRLLVTTAPDIVVYGEWLVPHSFRHYSEDAWRRFWVFDVFSHDGGSYKAWEDYGPWLEEMGLDVIQPLCTSDAPVESQLVGMMEHATFLVQDGVGAGEGIVVKRYDWKNQHGRQPWAKLIRNEFKAANSKEFGPHHVHGKREVEKEIVAEKLTDAFIKKEWAKVVGATMNDEQFGQDFLVSEEMRREFVLGHRGKIIPRFLGTFWLTFVDEEMRGIVKKWKNPTVDFGRLQQLATSKAKKVLQEWF